MYEVDEKPETIHLYVVREEEARPSLVPVILSVLALSILIALGVLLPYQQPEIRTAIRVPAVLLPLTTFSTSVTIIPTGEKTYPATTAHGTLTITNGSVIAEHLPAGMIFAGSDGVEVVTTESVDVPAGNGTSYGTASVTAQAVVAGGKGNIAPLDIQLVYGTSLYIKNYRDFTGGKEAQTVKFITSQDRQISLSQARGTLTQQTIAGLLFHPCAESVTGTTRLYVTWICQFVKYDVPDLPGVRVLHASVVGKLVLLDIVYVERPRILTAK